MAQQNDDRFKYLLRIVTFGCGVALIALGIVKFASFSISGVRDFFLTIYYILFGLLVCLSEMPCERLMSCFFFLKFYIGKALFFLFLGTIAFSWSSIYYLIISIVFFVASGFYFFLFFSCSTRDYKNPESAEAPKVEVSTFQKREIDNA